MKSCLRKAFVSKSIPGEIQTQIKSLEREKGDDILLKNFSKNKQNFIKYNADTNIDKRVNT